MISAGALWLAAEAAEAPPVTLPSGTLEAGKALATEHGLLGLLLFFAGVTIVALAGFIVRRQGTHEAAMEKREADHAKELADVQAKHTEDRQAWLAQTSALQEARLTLAREVFTALSNATSAISMHTQSTGERTASADALNGKITDLVSVMQAQLSFHRDSMARIEAGISSNAGLMQQIAAQKGLPR